MRDPRKIWLINQAREALNLRRLLETGRLTPEEYHESLNRLQDPQDEEDPCPAAPNPRLPSALEILQSQARQVAKSGSRS